MSHCFLCQQQKPYFSGICQHCFEDLPWNTLFCNQCALPLPTGITNQPSCQQCSLCPPHFSVTRAAFSYDFPVNRLITDFKDNRNPPMGKLLARLLGLFLMKSKCLQENPPELLIPVPSHTSSVNARGYNPAQIIAKSLSKTLIIPTDNRLIVKRKTLKQQKYLSAEKRQINLRNAFSTTKRGELMLPNYYRVAVIDDVFTTGATANMMAKTICDAGVTDVIIWTIARTA